jgi:hypothetical protein
MRANKETMVRTRKSYLMTEEDRNKLQTKYPHALSRDFGEGGYTFLKRVLRKNISTGKPVILNVGENYLIYAHSEGDKTFMDGVSLLEGQDEKSMEILREVGDQYRVEQGIAEIAKEDQEHSRGRLR